MTLNPAGLCKGCEQSEMFGLFNGRQLCQYDYRHHDGTLFSTVAIDLKDARVKRDRWLDKKLIRENEARKRAGRVRFVA